MRRPHIYERSVPRTRRQAYQEPAGDPDIYGWAIVRTLPAMIQDAEDAGLTIVASHPTRVRIPMKPAGYSDFKPATDPTRSRPAFQSEGGHDENALAGRG